MVTRRNIVLLLVCLLGIGAVVFFFPSEKKRIRKQFATLSRWAEKEGQENQLIMGRKIQKLRAVLADTIHVEAPAYEASGTYAAGEMAQRATIGRSRYPQISLTFFDMEIDVLDAHTAKVLTTARLTGTSPEDESIHETHEIECALQKIEGTWVFTEFEVVDVLKK